MKKGFTLIELMVVIVIMGILAAVAVPKIFGNVAKAKISGVPEVLTQFEQAVTNYYILQSVIPAAETDMDFSMTKTNTEPVYMSAMTFTNGGTAAGTVVFTVNINGVTGCTAVTSTVTAQAATPKLAAARTFTACADHAKLIPNVKAAVNLID